MMFLLRHCLWAHLLAPQRRTSLHGTSAGRMLRATPVHMRDGTYCAGAGYLAPGHVLAVTPQQAKMADGIAIIMNGVYRYDVIFCNSNL